jgi:hypothetical protein
VEETDVPWDAGTPVTILPTADFDEVLRLLREWTDGKTRLRNCDWPSPGDGPCTACRTLDFLATHDSKGGGNVER